MSDMTPEQAAFIALLERVQACEDAARVLAKENLTMRRRVMELEIAVRMQRADALEAKPVLSRLTGNPAKGRIAKS